MARHITPPPGGRKVRRAQKNPACLAGEHQLGGVALPVARGEGLGRAPERLQERRLLLGQLLDVRGAVQVLAHEDLGAERVAEEGVGEELDRARPLAVALLERRLDLPGRREPRRLEDVDVERLLGRPVAVDDGDVAPGRAGDPLHAGPVEAPLRVLLAGGVTDPFGHAGPRGVRELVHCG
jgi:hypothetical protein